MDTIEFKEDYFIYSCRAGLYKAVYDDILFVKCDKPFVYFQLSDRKFSLDGCLHFVKQHLKDHFIQINRQVIVNMKFADSIVKDKDGYCIQIMNKHKFKISARRKKEVQDAFFLYGCVINT